MTTILNPAPAAALPDELLRLTDFCIPNETETELLTGIAVATREAGISHAPGFAVEAVHSTGAGDAFVGSLAVFLAEGASMEDAEGEDIFTETLGRTKSLNIHIRPLAGSRSVMLGWVHFTSEAIREEGRAMSVRVASQTEALRPSRRMAG